MGYLILSAANLAELRQQYMDAITEVMQEPADAIPEPSDLDLKEIAEKAFKSVARPGPETIRKAAFHAGLLQGAINLFDDAITIDPVLGPLAAKLLADHLFQQALKKKGKPVEKENTPEENTASAEG